MKGDCNICVNRKLPSDSATCVDCGLSRKNYKPITNADRIRAMTDEELAKLLDNVMASCGGVMGGRNCMADCRDCWLDWLKREANDET